jgi:hypothetical protein
MTMEVHRTAAMKEPRKTRLKRECVTVSELAGPGARAYALNLTHGRASLLRVITARITLDPRYDRPR